MIQFFFVVDSIQLEAILEFIRISWLDLVTASELD